MIRLVTKAKDQEREEHALNVTASMVNTDIKKVSCSKCSRRRDLYYVGSEIYCVDDALVYLVSLINN